MAEYEAARLAGKSLAKTLGRGWTWKVWENLGWHYKAISPCGRIKVTSHNCAFLGDPGSSGGRWAEHGRTPKSAVRNVIAAAKKDLAKIWSDHQRPMTNWKKVGYRSVKHLGIPKMVVRFGRNGAKAKILQTIPVAVEELQTLMREATDFWQSLKGVK